MSIKSKGMQLMKFDRTMLRAILKNGIQRKFNIILLSLSIIPLIIVATFIYYFSLHTVRNDFVENSNRNIKQLSVNLDNSIKQMEKLSMMVFTDKEAQKCFRRIQSENYTVAANDLEKTLQLLTNISAMHNDISGLYIYSGNFVFYKTMPDRQNLIGLGYAQDTDYKKAEWFEKVISKNGDKILFPTHEPFYVKSKKEPVFSLSREIVDVNNGKSLGVILMDGNIRLFRELCPDDIFKEGWITVIDPDFNIVYSTHSGEIGLKFDPGKSICNKINGQPYGNEYVRYKNESGLLNFYTSGYTKWKILQFIPVNVMMKSSDTIGRFIFFLGIICCFVTIYISILLSRNLSKPIIHLNNIIKKIGKGDFSQKIFVKRKDEIGELAVGVNEMTINLQELLKRTANSQVKQKEAELKALQNQINPHFLYNTLESIQMKAVLNNQEEIADMVSTLGKLFKLSISKGKEIVKFHQELEHVGIYIKIQKMRHGDKIEYEIDFDEELKEMYTLKLILQPIVENAISHGLENKREGGKISIRGEISSDCIIIAIQDNGVGMNLLELEKIRREIAGLEQYDSKMKNIGIKNVSDRIKLYFGDEYGIKIESEKYIGTTVFITLSAVTDPDGLNAEKIANNIQEFI